MDSTRAQDHRRNDLEQPDDGKTIVWGRRGRIRLAVLGSSVALAAAAVAGCGGAADGTQAANANRQPTQGQGAQPQLSSDQRDQLKKFRDCMKKNGVDLPDFGSGGPPQGGPPAGVDPTSSKFRSAIQECAQYRPQGGPAGGMAGPPGAGKGGAPSGGYGPPGGARGGSGSGPPGGASGGSGSGPPGGGTGGSGYGPPGGGTSGNSQGGYGTY